MIAENASLLANPGFANPGAHADLLVAALAFTLQIYADFSGYSDIAKGIATLLGFDLVWNFRWPYLAANPSELWRGWHLSLSEWFRDYVFIPLGGSRRGFARTAVNLLITMTLVGLWHGAAWTYILWGLYCGLLLVAHRLWRILRGHAAPASGIQRTLLILCTFLSTVFGWVIFRSDSVAKLAAFVVQLPHAKITPVLVFTLLLLSLLPAWVCRQLCMLTCSVLMRQALTWLK